MTSDKFPPYPEIDNSGFMFFRKDDFRGFTGSINKGLITTLISLQCSRGNPKCNNLLIQDNSPKTGYCGHLFCAECATMLVDDYNNSTEEARARPRGYSEQALYKNVRKEDYEVEYRSDYDDMPLYNCQHCSAVPRKEDKYYDYLKLFSDNIMLNNIYNALKEPGFECKGLFKGGVCGFHPKHNSLNFHSSDLKNVGKYMCVWHADDHLQPRSDTALTTMSVSNAMAPPLPTGTYLSSLDRDNRMEIVAFYHCTCCRAELQLENKSGNDYPSQLECGHFVGPECVQGVNDKINKKKGSDVLCFFCKKSVDFSIPAQKYFIFPSKFLGGKVAEERGFVLYGCKLKCEPLHPRPNLNKKSCVWCRVEEKLKWKQNERDSGVAGARFENTMNQMGISCSKKKSKPRSSKKKS